MGNDEMRALAETWWAGVQESDWDKTECIDEIINNRPDEIPTLLAALVSAAPASGPHYVGTSILEDLFYQSEMSSVLTAEQIAWLVDSNAPGRHDYL